MKMSEFESRLQKHAEITKSVMATPFDIKTEEFAMTNKRHTVKKSILLAAVITCLLGLTAFAAVRFLTPSEVAQNLGDNKLAVAFEGESFTAQTATDGKYTASLLGVVSGRDLSDFKSSTWDILPERTYAVVAVEKTDKTPMTIGEPLMITPLIQGLNPWEYKIASMHGSYTEDVIDGVLYRIIEMDSIECFADQKIYLAIADNMFISNEHFDIDEESGEITANENYSGTNIIFELAIDKSKEGWRDDEIGENPTPDIGDIPYLKS